MSRTVFAFGQIACTWAAKHLFFAPGGWLLAAAEWCQARVDGSRPRDGP